jgi:hypothetical protein
MSNILNHVSEYDAWRTGFEIGASACAADDNVKSPVDFSKEIASGELNDLLLMANFGRHEKNGIWTIVGIRMAIYMIVLTQWKPSQRQSDDTMKDLWSSIENQSPEVIAAVVGEDLVNHLMIPIVMIDEEASAFISPYLR